MDQRSQELFDKILTKDPEALNSDEIAFLRARRSYLKKTQLDEYNSILEPKKASQTSVKEPAKKKDAKE